MPRKPTEKQRERLVEINEMPVAHYVADNDIVYTRQTLRRRDVEPLVKNGWVEQTIAPMVDGDAYVYILTDTGRTAIT